MRCARMVPMSAGMESYPHALATQMPLSRAAAPYVSSMRSMNSGGYDGGGGGVGSGAHTNAACCCASFCSWRARWAGVQ